MIFIKIGEWYLNAERITTIRPTGLVNFKLIVDYEVGDEEQEASQDFNSEDSMNQFLQQLLKDLSA